LSYRCWKFVHEKEREEERERNYLSMERGERADEIMTSFA
jgi:hypothetical protein